MARSLDDYGSREYIDSRDLVERLNELRTAPNGLEDDEREELKQLVRINTECVGYSDWYHGVTLVPEDEFEEYAHQLADDIGAINRDANWPLNHIDWAAAADSLRQDYTEIKVNGTTYLMRV